MPALLAYLRFLSLEIRTLRVREAALAVRAIPKQGVKQEGKNITIAISPDRIARQDALSRAEFAISMWGAMPVESSGPDTEIKVFARGLDLFFATAESANLQDSPGCVTCKRIVPFFVAMRKDGLLTPFACLAMASFKLDGVEEWLSSNKMQFDALARWIATYDQQKK